MANYELQSLLHLSNAEQCPAQRLDELVNRYKFGVRKSEWESAGLRERLGDAETIIRRRVIGQNEAVDRVMDLIKRAWLGLAAGVSGRSHRPRGVLFFAGPTGVGKTELAKSLAEVLFGSEERMLRFDMSEYAAEHADQRLLGSPPGYVGYEEGGQLTNQVKERPFSVLLFDEIEKAHPRIFDKFLQILDDGRLTDGKGDTVYFSESVIVFTSNLGTANVDSTGEPVGGKDEPPPYPRIREAILAAIARHFNEKLERPEILNRFGDNFVVFDYIRARKREHEADRRPHGAAAHGGHAQGPRHRAAALAGRPRHPRRAGRRAARPRRARHPKRPRPGTRRPPRPLAVRPHRPRRGARDPRGQRDPGRGRRRSPTLRGSGQRRISPVATLPRRPIMEHQHMEIWAHSYAYPVTALGPGDRLALWVSGCTLGCRGCVTPELWDRDAGSRTSTSALARQVLGVDRHLDGVTLTGGEPFEQAAALADLLDRLREHRPHWNVLVYSGLSLAALRRRGAAAGALLARTDVLVAGAYRPDRPPNHPLAGSGNQRLHYLTERGRALRQEIDALPPNRANLGLRADGQGEWLIGVMDPGSRAAIRDAIRGRATPIEDTRCDT